ncbi:hypothetical protein TRIUR3_25252 [Triticum urartu]|uniref:Uncharacterized protein n=1 Tax=Triticum urartu TaxID=4572 RepID=M7YSU0_TRIUA|nr:hypothetical protein TRIUR3_25252 [Triticum urartu]
MAGRDELASGGARNLHAKGDPMDPFLKEREDAEGGLKDRGRCPMKPIRKHGNGLRLTITCGIKCDVLPEVQAEMIVLFADRIKDWANVVVAHGPVYSPLALDKVAHQLDVELLLS